eukprot:scaffold1236_cov503-Prasinococcus_capsulatus_cf.AAC.12
MSWGHAARPAPSPAPPSTERLPVSEATPPRAESLACATELRAASSRETGRNLQLECRCCPRVPVAGVPRPPAAGGLRGREAPRCCTVPSRRGACARTEYALLRGAAESVTAPRPPPPSHPRGAARRGRSGLVRRRGAEARARPPP